MTLANTVTAKRATIRRATTEDLASLTAIETASFAQPWSRAAVAAELRHHGATLWIAQRGSASPAALGYAAFRCLAGEAELLRIAIIPTARRGGLARRLIAAGLAEVARQGATLCHLEVAADNLTAVELYRQLDFAQVGRRPNYYGRGEAALLFTKSLPETL